MKKLYTCIVALVAILAAVNTSYAIGNDVIIKNLPLIDQQKVEIDIAFNGWVYAAFNTYDSASNKGGITVMRSKNNGYEWSNFSSFEFTGNTYPAFDLVVAGTDTNSLFLFLASVSYNSTNGNYIMNVAKYDARTSALLAVPFYHSPTTQAVLDVAIATDYRFPGVGTNPYSVGLIYSCRASLDSVNFSVSVDGGNTFSAPGNIMTTASFFRKVAISFGRSVSSGNGRYFFAWELLPTAFSRNARIYTSRNTTQVVTGFIAPQRLDSLDASMEDVCRNPRIAVQQSADNNDSISVTAVVTVERDYIGGGTDYDILGFYNGKAHSTNYWYRFDISTSGTQAKQADVAYNIDSANFIITHFDSTTQQLRTHTNGRNLSSTLNAWAYQYNYDDSTIALGNPSPRVAINPKLGKPAFTWIKNNLPGNKGVAYYDAGFAFEPVIANIYDSICEGTSTTFNGATITQPGIHSAGPFASSQGNDSTARLFLYIRPQPAPTITQNGNVLSTQPFSNYQWYLAGSSLSGANAQTYTATAIGSYTVSVTDAHGCKDTSAAYSVTGVGIDELLAAGIRLYPNPVSDVVTVELPAEVTATIQISDVQGKLVMNKQLTGTATLDVRSLAKGVYAVLITTQTKTIQLKLVK